MEISLIQTLDSHTKQILTDKLNYKSLSDIQQQVLQNYSTDCNLIVQSPNGSGKSLALVLLLLLKSTKLAIVLAPTREIAV